MEKYVGFTTKLLVANGQVYTYTYGQRQFKYTRENSPRYSRIANRQDAQVFVSYTFYSTLFSFIFEWHYVKSLSVGLDTVHNVDATFYQTNNFNKVPTGCFRWESKCFHSSTMKKSMTMTMVFICYEKQQNLLLGYKNFFHKETKRDWMTYLCFVY